MPERAPIACIVGPTASGKSDAAQIIAQELGGEVVSADSMQVYRGMDIGTGKVLPKDRIVAHHCLDIVDPDEPYSAALFQRDARAAFEEIAGRGYLPVLAGGTGFYVRAAIDAYDFPEGEQVANPTRERYSALLEERGAQAVWEELERLDARSAALIHPHNAKRVIRALELLTTGTTYVDQLERLQSLPQAVPARMIGLAVEPDALCERIEARVDRMREEGLEDEVRSLMDRGFTESLTAPQAIGYKEIVAALEGRTSLDEAYRDIKRATRRYAKRQRTWFRRDARIQWISATGRRVDEVASEAIALLRAYVSRDG